MRDAAYLMAFDAAVFLTIAVSEGSWAALVFAVLSYAVFRDLLRVELVKKEHYDAICCRDH